MYSPEDNAAIASYRAKAAAGTLTEDDLKHVVALLRQARKGAVEGAARKRSAAKAATKSGDDLLNELEGM